MNATSATLPEVSTARLRTEVFEDVEDMPRALLAERLGVSTTTLRQYMTGATTPTMGPVNRLAAVLGRPPIELLVFDPAREQTCPSWCDDHELLTTHRKGRGAVEVLSDQHGRRPTARGPLHVEILRYIDVKPLNGPWPRTFIRAGIANGHPEKDCSVHIGGLTLEEVRWLAAELVRAAETLEAELPS